MRWALSLCFLTVMLTAWPAHAQDRGAALASPWPLPTETVDPALGLRPPGTVHLVLAGHLAYLGGEGEFAEAFDAAFAPMLDICVWPSLSLHVRVGFRVGGHGPLGIESRALGTAYLRGLLMIGIHAARVVSVRLGAELGPELVLESMRTSAEIGLGGAAVAQLGVRVFDGQAELALDLAIDIRPGTERVGVRIDTYTHAAPRIGVMLAVTF